MKALSIKQPWAWLILNGKDIENRSGILGPGVGPLLLHSSKTYDTGCMFAKRGTLYLHQDFIEWLGLRDEALIPRLQEALQTLETGGIVGIAERDGWYAAHSSPWYVGDYGLMLRNVRPLTFVPCNGALGFWEVPDEIVQRLGLEAAHA